MPKIADSVAELAAASQIKCAKNHLFSIQGRRSISYNATPEYVGVDEVG
jgi:hypothetical protein